MSKDDIVICPQCKLNNTTWLYGNKYTCNRCKADFVYEEKIDIPRRDTYSSVSYTNDFSSQPSIFDQQMRYIRFSRIMAFVWLVGVAILYTFVIFFSQPDRLLSLKNLFDHW